jgi:outer membrane protein assembly factor BamB
VYGLHRQTGALVWRYRTGSAVVAGLAVSDGKLYVGSTDRCLHAFKLEEK